MSAPIFVILVIESALIAFTTLLLVQPPIIFKPPGGTQTGSSRFIIRLSGVFLLCVTFCWSIVVGAVLTLHGIV